MEEEALLEAARAIRSYLPELIPDGAVEIDARIGAYLALEPVEAARQLTGLLSTEPALLDWAAELLADPDLRPPDVARRVKAYQPLPGIEPPVPAERYSCPEDGDRVWYRRSAGQTVPSCPDHGVDLVPAPLKPSPGTP